jgi:hypothetical protein
MVGPLCRRIWEKGPAWAPEESPHWAVIRPNPWRREMGAQDVGSGSAVAEFNKARALSHAHTKEATARIRPGGNSTEGAETVCQHRPRGR